MKKVFVFFASKDNNVLGKNEVHILIDSGCTNYMLKDRELFATLDESFSGSVGCANKSESVRVRLNFMCVRIMEREQK